MFVRQNRCLSVLTVTFGLAMLAPNEVRPQSPLVTKMRSKDTEQTKRTISRAPTTIEKLRNWHVGDDFPTNRFGKGGLNLEKRFDADRPVPFLEQQVRELQKPQWLNGDSEHSREERRKVVENLKRLGPEAVDAIPTLIWSAMNDPGRQVQVAAMETLVEFGGMLPVVVASETLLKPRVFPETAKSAEEGLLKLLPTVVENLTRNDALFLFKVHIWCSPPVATAIEATWTARGITHDDLVAEIDWMAKEAIRIAKEEQLRIARDAKINNARIAREEKERRAAALKAARDMMATARTEIQMLCVKLLQPGDDLDGAKAAEESLLTLIPAAGDRLTPRDAFFLDDVRRAGHSRLSKAIATALDVNGFRPYFEAMDQYRREHNGEELVGRVHVRDLPEQWQRYLMTPDSPRPDYTHQLFNGPVGDGLSNAERRRLEIDRQNRERAANRVR